MYEAEREVRPSCIGIGRAGTEVFNHLRFRQVEVLDDEWTVVTVDGSLSAHFEHTIAITGDGPIIMTLPD